MEAFFASLALVALSELGDKTMLVVLALAGQGSAKQVFGGTFLAVLLLFGGAVLLGKAAVELLPRQYIAYGSGILFIAIGIYGLVVFLRRKEEHSIERKPAGNLFWPAFGIFAVAELGDKTQLATVGLTVKFSNPWAVFFGAVAGETLIVLLAILLGKVVARYLPTRLINLIACFIFIAVGVYIVVSVAFQFTIL